MFIYKKNTGWQCNLEFENLGKIKFNKKEKKSYKIYIIQFFLVLFNYLIIIKQI